MKALSAWKKEAEGSKTTQKREDLGTLFRALWSRYFSVDKQQKSINNAEDISNIGEGRKVFYRYISENICVLMYPPPPTHKKMVISRLKPVPPPPMYCWVKNTASRRCGIYILLCVYLPRWAHYTNEEIDVLRHFGKTKYMCVLFVIVLPHIHTTARIIFSEKWLERADA